MRSPADLAYGLGVYAFGPAEAQQGAFLEVYRRQADGAWKIVAGMFTLASPAL